MYENLCEQKITCTGGIAKIQGLPMAFAVSVYYSSTAS